MRLNPFRAIRPAPGLEAAVAAPPYDVVSREEAAAYAAGNPQSFLHVGRSDIDLPAGTDPYDAAVYATARANLDRFLAGGTLARDPEPAVFLYRLVMDGRAQTGVVACVHVDDYEQDVIRKHEKTRPDKEDDRTRHVLTLNANAEPVFLTVRDQPDLDRLLATDTARPPLFDFTSGDGVRHTGWRAASPVAYVRTFATIPLAYVADGHHRCASAWRAGRERRHANDDHTGREEYNWFLAALFPASQLRILPYNRLVRDLRGMTPPEFLLKLGGLGKVTTTTVASPARPGRFCVYVAGSWHQVDLDRPGPDPADPLAGLDVTLLQDRVLGPLLGIHDPRTDKRIDFVGGIRGTAELEARVDSGEMAAAFSLFPTTVEQLMAVSDASRMMPPKSTWFEPKLKSGLWVHELD